jgi:hypothetical protein
LLRFGFECLNLNDPPTPQLELQVLCLAPRVLSRTVRFQKMVQHVQKRQNVSFVPALLSLANIVHDHVSDFLHAVLLARKILGQRGGGDFRHMLMLRDCQNLGLGQAG